MKVNAYAGNWMANRSTGTAPRRKTSFADCMAAASDKKAAGMAEAQSPTHVRIDLLDYAEWRKSREPIDIPNTNGWTEENIQYLKERYPGELSPYERLEALQTITDMGCITPEEYQKAIGTDKEMVVCDAGEATCTSGRLEEDGYSPYWLMQTLHDADWLEALKDLTISKADTLDRLFDLLDAGSRSLVDRR